MIEIDLTVGLSASVKLKIDDSVGWKSRHPGEEFRVIQQTGLAAPMAQVFMKRYSGGRASAHDLLISCLAKPMLYTPRVLGYVKSSGWHYYTFTLMDQSIDLNVPLENNKAPHDLFLTRTLVCAILNTLLTVGQDLAGRGFYYPDLTYANMRYHKARESIFLIDMDSCYPVATPVGGAGKAYNESWWVLYKQRKLSSPKHLHATMVLSMALVLCRALAALAQRGKGANVYDMLAGYPADQYKLFAILDNKDASGFHELFSTPKACRAHVPLLFTDWQTLIGKLQSGAPVDWPLMWRFVVRLLTVTGPDLWTHYLEGGLLRGAKA